MSPAYVEQQPLMMVDLQAVQCVIIELRNVIAVRRKVPLGMLEEMHEEYGGVNVMPCYCVNRYYDGGADKLERCRVCQHVPEGACACDRCRGAI
jgi:hypothetical protein